jgi:zinc transport system permease protein
MISEFLIRAVLGGIGIAAIAAPLGCFVVWRRMAYFGDTLAHSALLGLALAFIFELNLNLGILLTALALTFLLATLQRQRQFSTDTLLGIFAHAGLSIGMVVIAVQQIRIDLVSYLFGDILSLSRIDVAMVWVVALPLLTTLIYYWRPLIKTTLHEDMAEASGVNTHQMRVILLVMMALLVAISIKLIGALLITSMLIIPAAAARSLASSPIRMAGYAAAIGMLSVITGLAASYQWDTPSGPSIVMAAMVIFVLSLCAKPIKACF